MEIDWDFLNRIATIITIVGIPSVFILYAGLRRKLKTILKLSRDNYSSKRLAGKYSFDYSNNNGSFKLGENEKIFELKFSKASDTSIHIYRDPPSISGIALVNGIYNISKIKDASIYDMSSRTRTPQEGEIIILKNIYGNYCAVKIIDIKDRTRSDEKDEITFEYVINDAGNVDFSE